MEKPQRSKGGSFTVSSDQEDRRLDRVLRGLYANVPLGAIMRGLRTGAVRVNGSRAGGDQRLVKGDLVTVPWESAREEELPLPGGPKLKTLYRDSELWCVEKEAGLLVQADTRGGDCLARRVLAELGWTRSDFRPAPLHRLDRNVSGVVAVALNAPMARLLSQLLREGRIIKKYRALVQGDAPRYGEITVPLAKDERNNRAVPDVSGKDAVTRYRKIAGDGSVSLVELELVTGRPHQARIHMAVIGHPIVGDAKYGPRHQDGMESRILLHAYSLTFPDDEFLPLPQRGLSVVSPLPVEFQRFGRALR